MGKRNKEEHSLQVGCVNWFRLQYPRLAKALFSVPNGANVTEREGKWLKAEGLTSGVSDLILAIPNRENRGVFIEIKTPSGRVSKEQKDFLALMSSLGYRTEVVRTFDRFMDVVREQIKNR